MTYTDEQIKDDILDEIAWDPAINTEDVGVTVHNGAVTLTGMVDTYPEKHAAERAAKRVKGVLAIAEEMKVKIPGDTRVTDADIASKIVDVLEWMVAMPADSVQAEVRNGRVVLTGQVDWNFQRETVEKQIAPIKGVRAIDNLLAVKPQILKNDLKTKISKALHRNADVEASDVDIAINGGQVTLSGNVKAYYERKLIEDAVWAAPGVTEIVDNIRVQ